MSARSSSSAAIGRYGRTWAVESRSHMAGMSPVSRKVVPSAWRCTVVVSVLANAALKFSAQSACSAPHSSVMRSMKRRTESGTVWYGMMLLRTYVNFVNK